MTDILSLIGRTQKLFLDDLHSCEEELKDIVSSSSFLVLGGAGSIGQAVTKEIFKRNPKKLHFNTDKPDGTMIKLTDSSKLNSLGWKHKVELRDGIRTMYKWYLGENK